MLDSFLGGSEARGETLEPLPPRRPGHLRIASWNLEWLNTEGLGQNERSAFDLARLARYAERLDADVVAVQEVASEEALERVFPRQRYAVHLAKRGRGQRAGFAYRRDLDVRALRDVEELSRGGLRAGADLEITLDDVRLRLLSVHLKAFCVRGPLSEDNEHCAELRAQLPALERWIDARASEGSPFAVLGDFNRTLGDDDELWRELDDAQPASLTLERANVELGSLCHSRRKERPFIDHIVLGGDATKWLVRDSFREVRYDESDKRLNAKLSDHCPILVELEHTSVR